MPAPGGLLHRLFHPHNVDVGRLYRGVALTAVLLAIGFVVLSPLKLLGAALAALVVVAAFWKPEWMLLALCVYIPFEPFVLKYVPDDLYLFARYGSESLVYLLVLATAWRVWKSRGKPGVAHTPLNVPFALFIVTALASVVINLVPTWTAILGLRQIIRFVLLFFVVANLRPSLQFGKVLTAAMLGVMLVQSSVGIAQRLSGGALDEILTPTDRRFADNLQLTTGTIQTWAPGERVSAFMGRYEQLGTFMCFFGLMAVGFLYALRGKGERQWMWAVLLVAAPAFVFTQSRTSWVGFLLGLLLIGGVLAKDRLIRIGVVVGTVALAVFLALNAAVIRYVVDLPEQTFAERVLEIFSYERWSGEYYGIGRLFWIVQTPLVVVPSSPVFGVGPGQYGGGAATALHNTTVYDKLGLPFGVFGEEGFIDNNWFSLWGETGTLGVAFYAWMLVALFVFSVRTWLKGRDPWVRGLALGYCGALVLVSFAALLGTYFEIRTLAVYLWVFGGLVWVMGERDWYKTSRR
jgi:hypothetical protein